VDRFQRIPDVIDALELMPFVKVMVTALSLHF
jgi:hypothetical protein